MTHQKPPTEKFVNLMLMPNDRSWLHQRIERRFRDMLYQGFVDEVAALMKQWNLTPNCPAMRSVGYRQVLGYLSGEYSREDMENKGIAATRQLAKRQLTWMRHCPCGAYFEPEKLKIQKIVATIEEHLFDSSQ